MSPAPSMEGEVRDTAHIGLLRRIFSFPVMLRGMLTVLSVLTVRDRLDDPDMWWHLKTGEVIYRTHAIPTTDLFSYTTNHHAWIPHEWLSQVLIYSAYRWGGYAGLMLWLCVFTSLLVIAGYTLCALYSGNAKTALVGALVVWFFSTTGDAIRPQLIGYLLLTLELLLVHLGSTRSPRWFLWLPPLFAVWVNCHGSFFLGLLVLGVFLLCSFFDFEKGALASSRYPPAHRRTLVLASGLSVAALFLNPTGLRQVVYPLNTLFQQPLNLLVVDEWKPLQLSEPRGLALFAILAGIFLLFIVRRPRLYLHELLLLAMGAGLAIDHRRMVFVFGILAAPALSRLIAGAWDGYDPKRDLPVMNAVMLTLAILIVARAFPSRANLESQIWKHSPVRAVEFIRSHHLRGPMLNAYDFGGYFIWALPEQPVFIDGRADLYEWAGVLGGFAKWSTLQDDPNMLLNKYGVGFCVLERESPMTQVMQLLPGWRLVYSDDQAVIFARSSPVSGR